MHNIKWNRETYYCWLLLTQRIAYSSLYVQKKWWTRQMERRRALEKWHGASTWNCLRPIVQKSNVSSVKDMLGHQNHTKYLLFQRLPKCANAIFGAFGSVVAACVWPIVDDFYFTSRVVYADNPDVLHLTFRCSVFFFFLSASKPTRIVSLFGTYCVSFVNTFNVDIRRQTDVCPLPVTMWATKKKKNVVRIDLS